MKIHMLIAELLAAMAGNPDVRTLAPLGYEGQVQALMSIEQATSAFETMPGVAPEMLSKTFALLQLRDRHHLGPDVRNVIFKDLCFVYLLPAKLSAYLKENRTNPEAVLNLIGQLFKKYGHGISVSELRMALADAQMWIEDIQKGMGENCLYTPCNKKNRVAHDLDRIKIILCVGQSSVGSLIAFRHIYGWSPWHSAVCAGRDDIVKLFIDWANDNNMIREFLVTKTYAQRTALHIAAFNGHTGILKTLLELAKKYDMVEELMDARDNQCHTTLYDANQHSDDQICEELISIIEEYSTTNKLARMSLRLNDQ